MAKITPKGEETKERLYMAAMRCIAKYGIDKTSVTVIAKEAKATRSLLGHYLPKKDDLFAEVLVLGIRKISEVTRDSLDYLPPLDAFLKDFKQNIDALEMYPEIQSCFNLAYYASNYDDRIKGIMSNMIMNAQEQTYDFLHEENKLRKNPYSSKELKQFAYSLHDMMAFYLMKRKIIHFNDLNKSDDVFIKSLTKYWKMVFS